MIAAILIPHSQGHSAGQHPPLVRITLGRIHTVSHTGIRANKTNWSVWSIVCLICSIPGELCSPWGGMEGAEEHEKGCGILGTEGPTQWQLMACRDTGTSLSSLSAASTWPGDCWHGSWEADVLLHYVFPLLYNLRCVPNRLCVSTLSPENWDQYGQSDFAFLHRKQEDGCKTQSSLNDLCNFAFLSC